MKKSAIFLIAFFLTLFYTPRQTCAQEIWGMTNQGGPNNSGTIFKTDGSGGNQILILPFAKDEGRKPYLSELVQADNGKFYGMTLEGGNYNKGVLFEFDLATNVYTKKLDFDGAAKGSSPFGGLIQASNGKLYGTTNQGGASGYGVLFEYDAATNSYTKILDFDWNNRGSYPSGSLIQASNSKIYGMTSSGGVNHAGILFEYNTVTNVFTKKIDFDGTIKGSSPFGSLMQASNGNLYGMTCQGGISSFGVLFEYDPIADVFTKRLDFDGTTNGSTPYGRLTQAANGKLYGMTTEGGLNTYGVLFEFDPVANVCIKKLDFDGTNSGRNPWGSLLLAPNGKLYAMTNLGGSNNVGILFEYNPGSSAFSKKLDFNGISNGSSPKGSLMQAANGKLYGMTHQGGTGNYGVLFEYDFTANLYAQKFEFDGYSKGKYPYGSLMQAANGRVYGMTYQGGARNFGVLFEFDPITNAYIKKIDFDQERRGAYPFGSLMQAKNGKLYGMTNIGGWNDMGVLFEYDPATNVFFDRLDFNGNGNGRNPFGSLMQASNGKLYGMTYGGGTYNRGVLFEYDPSNGAYSKKVEFDGNAGTFKGSYPRGSLIQASNGKLYGMTYSGGTYNQGVLFEYDPIAGVFTKRLDFDGTTSGGLPHGSLMQASNGKLYGMVSQGGINNYGVLFEYDLGTNTFNKILDFDGSNNGNYPYGSLLQSTNTKLYGMTSSGGANNYGVLFEYDASTNSYNKKLDFTTNGANPVGDLIQIGLPVLTTGIVSNVTTNSIQTGGIITGDRGNPITARGVCWSTGTAPTTDLNSKTSDGTGTGTFTSIVTGLSAGTTYYLRAYATNSAGTSYGSEVSFKTYNAVSVPDIDGNYYYTVTIGSQTWLAENLKTTKFNDGTDIPLVTANEEWSVLSTPGFSWYNNNYETYGLIYGALYNWYTVTSANLCPIGWHVPADAEWTILANFLGGDAVAGGKLKETGITHWWDPNTGATNESGFTGLPGGCRDLWGFFYDVGIVGHWRSSTEYNDIIAWSRALVCNESSFQRTIGYHKRDGQSVRCIKDAAQTPVHFTPVWLPGNGMDHMNLYAITATIDGADLQSGDEIGVYDGDVCVGAGVLTQVLSESNYLECKVSCDDPDTPLKDGYIAGNTISFKVWDSSANSEVSNVEAAYVSGTGIFSVGGTAAFNLNAITSITQDIGLTAGWNIMSFAVETGDMSMISIMNPMISAGTLVKVQDEKGNAIEQLPAPIGWVDNIGLMIVSEGYKIKVSSNTTLNITGKPVTLPYTIDLSNGWNIMGYPSMSSQAAMAAFQSLINAGTLLKVQDEQGNAIEQLPAPIGWVDNIHTLAAGEGYKVKVSAATSITINNSGKGEYESAESVALIKPSHFKPAYRGNGFDHMNIYLKGATIGGVGIKTGDEIGVFDGGVCVGSIVVEDPNSEYIMVTASLDDPTTTESDGFIAGHTFILKLWDRQSGIERNTQNVQFENGSGKLFERLGTSVLAVDFETMSNTSLGDAYPNPSGDKTTFTFQLAGESKVRFEIYNMKGDLIKILVDDSMSGGIHTIEWDHRSAEGSEAKAGIYFYRLRLNDFSQVKSLVIQ